GTDATGEVPCTPRDGRPSDCKAWTMPSHTIPAYSSKGYNSGDAEFDNLVTRNSACMGWDGTAEVKSTNGVKLAGIANTVWRWNNRAGIYSLAGVEDGRVSLVFPKQMRSGSSKSAINVMNVSASTVDIEVRYYDTNGNEAPNVTPSATLQPLEAIGFNTASVSTNMPKNFEGSAIVYTDKPALIAISNLIYTGGSESRVAIYNGIGR
ncbi:MAG: hypothetical protein GY759_15990, partial [Chloroflexi bacterium]|nr:hypothetical protein [Chloroflexota bacterium]